MVTALFIEHLLYTEHCVSSLNIHEADVIESLTWEIIVQNSGVQH